MSADMDVHVPPNVKAHWPNSVYMYVGSLVQGDLLSIVTCLEQICIYICLSILWRPKPLKRCVRSVVRLRYIHHLISEKPWKNYENTYFLGGQTLSLVTGCGFNKNFKKNMSFFDFCLHYAPQRPIEELTWRYNSTEKSGDSHSSLKCKIYSFGLHC